MPKSRWKPLLFCLQCILFLLPVGYFLFKTVTAETPPPLLRLNPYQRFLSALKMTGPTFLFVFRPKGQTLFLPYSFFEPEVLVTFLLILFLLVLGASLKGRAALYLGFIWFYLTLSPLIYQPNFGQIGFLGPPYLPLIGLFLVLCFLIGKFVSR